MKKINLLFYSIISSFLVLSFSCKEDTQEDTPVTPVAGLPSVNSISVNSIYSDSAVFESKLTSSGDSNLVVGVCLDTKEYPNFSSEFVTYDTMPAGKSTFKSIARKLVPNTKYFFRSYAQSKKGVSYGEQNSFFTLAVPKLETAAVSLIGIDSATSGGNVIDEGKSLVVLKGICWSTNPKPTIKSDFLWTIDGAGIGPFISKMTMLKANTTYYVRSYATSANGTGYGNELTFKTKP